MTRDPVAGGFVAVAGGTNPHHVLLNDGTWADPDAVPRERIREFGGCMLLATGQMVPLRADDVGKEMRATDGLSLAMSTERVRTRSIQDHVAITFGHRSS